MDAGRTSGTVRFSLAAVCALLAIAFAAPAARAQGSRGLGSVCQVSTDCTSMYCVAGICCDSSCLSSCQSCLASLTGLSNGVCRPVKSGQADPQGLCGTPICNGSTLTGGLCNGNGACQTGSMSCAPYTCNDQNTGCNVMCADNSDCSGGATCQGVTCATPDAGTAVGGNFDGPSAWNCAMGGGAGGRGGLVLAAALVACLAIRRRRVPLR
jgi:MYXO-CTERM domain-containing protein